MNFKTILLISLIFIFIPFVNAQEELSIQTLGDFTQGQNITLKQTCSNCTFINITSITAPDGLTVLVSDVSMDKAGTEYTYNFTDTKSIGRYVVRCFGDPNGIPNANDCPFDFYITQSGERRDINVFYGLIPILFFGLLMLILGFVFENLIIKYTMFTLSIGSSWVAIQFTSLVLQGYALVNDLTLHNYLLTFLQVFGWIIGGAMTLFIIYSFVKIKDWLEIRRGFKD